MKRVALLFWWCCFPSHVSGVGLDEFDETSLLQLAHAKHEVNQLDAAQPGEGQSEDALSEDRAAGVEAVENVAQQNQIAPNTNLVKMANLVSSMERTRADGAQEPSGSWGDTEKTALETLSSALENQFAPILDAEQSDDIRQFNARKEGHNLCITQNTEGKEAVNYALDLAVQKESKHRACRKSQKSWNTYKALAVLDESCSDASDILEMHKVYPNHKNLADSMKAAEKEAQTYANLAPATVMQDCALDQQDYESQWCAWRASKDNTCTQFKRCFDAIALGSLKSALETREGNRQMIWDTVIKLQCRIEHLLSTFGGASADTSAAPAPAPADVSDFNTDDDCSEREDTSRYVMALIVPDEPTCSGAADYAIAPCTQDAACSTCSDFIAQKYSDGNNNWLATTHVFPDVCRASCPVITGIPVQPIHEGCSSDPEGCEFYNAHKKACGNYDGGSEVQSTDCCVCATPNFIAALGCPTDGGSEVQSTTLNSATAVADVQCCAMGGVGPECFRPITDCLAQTDKTFAEAEQICRTAGKRLCTSVEVADSTCCGKGCGFDATFVWATLP